MFAEIDAVEPIVDSRTTLWESEGSGKSREKADGAQTNSLCTHRTRGQKGQEDRVHSQKRKGKTMKPTRSSIRRSPGHDRLPARQRSFIHIILPVKGGPKLSVASIEVWKWRRRIVRMSVYLSSFDAFGLIRACYRQVRHDKDVIDDRELMAFQNRATG